MNPARIVIAGTHSGVGKTSVTLALMAAFKSAGQDVQGFKVGPDYIDPSYHKLVTGKPSHNLDSWLLDKATVQSLFLSKSSGSHISVIEGVMGLFDGFGSREDTASTAEIAKILDAPVLLVLDARSLARSGAAMVLGYRSFDPNLQIKGVLLNKVGSLSHYNLLKESIESYTGVPVLGGFLREPKIQIPERHLGLKTAEENIEFHACLGSLMQLTKKDTQQPGIDLEKILKIAQDTSSFPIHSSFLLLPPSFPRKRESRKDISGLDSRFRGNDGGRSGNDDGGGRDGGRDGNNDGSRDNVTKPVRIGIAMDKAFSFYYQANLDILTELGAELAPFSPTKDENLPEDCSALYFGGGFPELYANELEENLSLKNQIKESVRAGLPIYAECGGLMFLSESLETLDGSTFSMAGVVPGKVTMTKNLKNFGYKEGNAVCDTLMSEKGENVRGHEFHYSKRSIPTSKDASAYELTHRRTGERQLEGYSNDSVLATYLHIHFLTNPNWAKRFFENAVQYRNKKEVVPQ